MKIGHMQFLRLVRFSPNGAYLADEKGGEVLLPKRYLEPQMTLDSQVLAFVYSDSEDRLVAITTAPKGFEGDIVALCVAGIGEQGVFLDLGLPKDLFMPTKNPKAFKISQKVVVKITLDKQNRLIARQNLAPFLRPFRPAETPPRPALLPQNQVPRPAEKSPIKSAAAAVSKPQKSAKTPGKTPQNPSESSPQNPSQKPLKPVEILPFLKTPLGLNCVVNGKYFGVIHNNDVNKALNIGESCRGIIKNIRADGKLDLALEVDRSAAKEAIVAALALENPPKLSFALSPEAIFGALNISKKAFKTAANALTREGKITFDTDFGGFVLAKIRGRDSRGKIRGEGAGRGVQGADLQVKKPRGADSQNSKDSKRKFHRKDSRL